MGVYTRILHQMWPSLQPQSGGPAVSLLGTLDHAFGAAHIVATVTSPPAPSGSDVLQEAKLGQAERRLGQAR